MIKDDEKFIQYLKELKILGAKAVKLELESEYLSETLLKEISNVLKENSMAFALKTGGFSSLNDICISKNIGADVIVAPMVETPYAFKKFIETLYSVYSKEELSNKKIYINIETDFGVKNFNEILKADNTGVLDGVVIGRGDLISSLNLPCSLIDSNDLFKTIFPVIKKCADSGKKIILGGKITGKSIDFIKKFPPGMLFGFETRKVFFKLENTDSKALQNMISRAIGFEIYYLNMLIRLQNQNTVNLQKRTAALQERL